MKTETITLTDCPECGEQTRFVKLGNEPARKVCGRFGCDWDGETLE